MDTIIKHEQIYCRQLTTSQFSSLQHKLHNHICTLYILERLLSWSTSQIRLSWPCPWIRLNLLKALFHMYLLCLSWPTSILVFFPTIHVSHMHPPLTTRQLNTSTQVNNMAVLHLIYNGITYLHHININTQSLLHTSFTRLGRPAGPDPSCREQLHTVENSLPPTVYI